MAASATEAEDRSDVDVVLQKPFRLKELVDQVRALCGE
jgi:DNA-binding response OmpR family regulator